MAGTKHSNFILKAGDFVSPERVSRSLQKCGKTVRRLKVRNTTYLIVDEKVEIQIYFPSIRVVYVEAKGHFSSFFDTSEVTRYILNVLDEMSIEEKESERTD